MIKQPGPSEPGHHHRTPALTVTDPRGLAVRAVEYRRSSADAQAIEQATRYRHDARGWPVAEIDPRLSDPNQRTVFSLSGVVVLLESVDAGWRLSLADENANTVDRWDGRYSHWRTVFDNLARPVTIYEKSQTQTEHRVTGRLSYAAFSEQAALHNQCGHLIRQDDAAGTCLFADYAVTGISLSETRHFLNQLDPPNWPLPVPAPVQKPVQEPGAQLETGNGATTLWRCNPLGERLSQIDAMGHQQLTAYTVAGELKGATVQLQHGLPVTVMHRVTHGASGQIEQQTLGCGVTRCHFYDPADGRLKRLVSRRPGSTLQALDYTYDPVGNVVQITDLAQPDRHFTHQHISAINTYRYDSLYQLIEATGREAMGALIGPQLPGRMPNPGDLSQLLNYCQTYDYDTAGNLIQLRHIGHESYTRTLQVAPDSNRGMPATGGREIENRFDANGNLQTLQPGQTLEWDLSNQLSRTVQVIRSQGLDDDERYIYDAQGQRLRKITTRHNKAAIDISDVRYLPGLEIHTREGQCLHIVIAAGVRCLHWEVGNPHAPANDVLRYSLDDHLGSSTLEVDKNAAIISHEGYYPFGGTAWWAARSGVEAAYKTIRYSGKERDASGLYYYGFRYYAPWLARWINPDPAGDVDGLNVYRMVRNNPLLLVDEQGLNPILKDDRATSASIALTEQPTLIDQIRETLTPLLGEVAITDVPYVNDNQQVQYRHDDNHKRVRSRRVQTAKDLGLSLSDAVNDRSFQRSLAEKVGNERDAQNKLFGQCAEMAYLSASKLEALARSTEHNVYTFQQPDANHTLTLLSKRNYLPGEKINWKKEHPLNSLVVDLWQGVLSPESPTALVNHSHNHLYTHNQPRSFVQTQMWCFNKPVQSTNNDAKKKSAFTKIRDFFK